MKPIDWHSMIIRWSALMFSLGAWAGIALVMATYLG